MWRDKKKGENRTITNIKGRKATSETLGKKVNVSIVKGGEERK